MMKTQPLPQSFKSWNDFYEYLESVNQANQPSIIWVEGFHGEDNSRIMKTGYYLNEIRLRAFDELRQKQKDESFTEPELRFLIKAMSEVFKLSPNVQNSSYAELTLRNKLMNLLYELQEVECRNYRTRHNMPVKPLSDESSNQNS